jgi:hypothetical protein
MYSMPFRMRKNTHSSLSLFIKINLEIFFISSCLVAEAITEHTGTASEPVFLNIYGAQESIPKNEFRQPL